MPLQPLSAASESSSEVTPDPGPRRHTLTGWAGIEEHLLKHDIGKINDYVNDIDTLLVFAGLSSAVLTAFVIETYGLLQPDNMATTNQLLAHAISLQLHRISNALNETLSTQLSPQPFVPSTSARWINSLFFTSLVLSLAAGFFGILAKQWLREYLQWNSPLSSPRENVLVRQIRFEAFNTWNVASTISAIPALLEMAVILFLIGVVILLWTLDDIVASFVTIIIVLFLGIVSAFTILPILFKKCPYKSPTAWACVTAYYFATSPVSFFYKRFKARVYILYSRWKYLSDSRVQSSFYSLCQGFLLKDWYAYWVVTPHTTRPVVRTPRSRSWRERDLESCAVTKLSPRRWWQASMDAREAAKLELCRELIPLKEDGTYEGVPDTDNIDDETADVLLLDISETSLLIRALSWVQQASQDLRVERYVDECIKSIHRRLPASISEKATQVYTVTNWTVVAALRANHISEPHSLLSSIPSSVPSQSAVTDVRRACDVRSVPRRSLPGRALHNDILHLRNASLCLVPRTFPTFRSYSDRLVIRLLHTGFHMSMAELENMESDFGTHVEDEVRRVYESFTLLNVIGFPRDSAGQEWYLDVLRSTLCSTSSKLATYAPSLYLGAFQLACQYARVVFDKLENKLFVLPGATGLPEYESLLSGYFGGNTWQYSELELNLFVIVAIKWLYYLRPSESIINNPIGPILDKMIGVTETLFHRGGRATSCSSAVDDAVWIAALWRNKAMFSTHFGPQFRRLLHCFEPSHRRAILVGRSNTIWQYLRWSLQGAHEGVNACESQTVCHWLPRHMCDERHCLSLATSYAGAPDPVYLMEYDDDNAPVAPVTVPLSGLGLPEPNLARGMAVAASTKRVIPCGWGRRTWDYILRNIWTWDRQRVCIENEEKGP